MMPLLDRLLVLTVAALWVAAVYTFRVACPEPELPGDIYCLDCTRKFDRAIGAIVVAAQLSLGLTDEEVDFFPFKLDYQLAK